MKTKKLLSLFLTAALLVCSFCSCSKTAGNDETDSNSSADFTLKYTYDSAYSDYDSSIVHAYEEFCDAVIAYDSSLRINTGYYSKIQQLVYTSFPLSYLIDSTSINEDKSGITIKYKFSEQQHKEKVEEFNKKINDIITSCMPESDLQSEYVINVYNYVTKNIKESSNAAITCFETVLSGEGTSFSYSNLFEYLLRQNDVEAYHVIGSDAANVSWGFSQAVMGEQIYYFDPMSEYFNNGGKQLYYFGMTDKDVQSEGLSSLKYSSNAGVEAADDKTFSPCRSAVSWEIKDSKLFVTQRSDSIDENDSKVVEIALK